MSSLNISAMAIRALAIGGKFCLLLYLGRLVSLQAVGQYGLFVATTTLLTYLAGLEFHRSSCRDLPTLNRKQQSQLVWSQLYLHLHGYLGCLPLILGVFYFDILPWHLFPWLVLVFTGSHLSQEISRILIATARPTRAYVVSSLTHGVWTLPVVALGLYSVDYRTTDFVYIFWAIGAWAATAIGTATLFKLGLLSPPATPTWQSIRMGLKTSLPFLALVVSRRSMDYSDRFLLQHYRGEAELGTYTVFSSIARILPDLVFAGFVSAVFPTVIRAFRARDLRAWQQGKEKLLRATVYPALFLTPAFAGVLYLVIPLLQSDLAASQTSVYFTLLIAKVIFSASLYYHYVLYSSHQDTRLLVASGTAALVNLTLDIAFVPNYGLMGAASATLVATVVLFLLEARFARQTAS